jgi:hypothetical protein
MHHHYVNYLQASSVDVWYGWGVDVLLEPEGDVGPGVVDQLTSHPQLIDVLVGDHDGEDVHAHVIDGKPGVRNIGCVVVVTTCSKKLSLK